MSKKRSPIQRFEDLPVWQSARLLVKGVYRASRNQLLKSDRGLVDQMTRAAVSITSNIAEGHERGTRRVYVQFCCIAKGSAGELRSQVVNAHDVELIDNECYRWLHEPCEDVSRQLTGYIKHLVESSESIRGFKYSTERDRNGNTWDDFLTNMGMSRLLNGQVVSKSGRSAESANEE
jgi:four helix bundle protein